MIAFRDTVLLTTEDLAQIGDVVHRFWANRFIPIDSGMVLAHETLAAIAAAGQQLEDDGTYLTRILEAAKQYCDDDRWIVYSDHVDDQEPAMGSDIEYYASESTGILRDLQDTVKDLLSQIN